MRALLLTHVAVGKPTLVLSCLLLAHPHIHMWDVSVYLIRAEVMTPVQRSYYDIESIWRRAMGGCFRNDCNGVFGWSPDEP